MFEKNGDVPKIIARFGESLTPAMIERYSWRFLGWCFYDSVLYDVIFTMPFFETTKNK